jgi:hypothetical protein
LSPVAGEKPTATSPLEYYGPFFSSPVATWRKSSIALSGVAIDRIAIFVATPFLLSFYIVIYLSE